MIIPIIFFALLLYSLSGSRNTYINFWLSLAFYFDPGGFLSGTLGGVFFGPAKYYDAFFLLMTICFLSAKDIHLKEIYSDKPFLRLVRYFIFYEIYYILIFGCITPLLNGLNADNNFSLFVLKQRTTVYGFFIVIYVYLFAKRGLLFHYKITVGSALICLSLFFIGFVTGISVIPTETLERYAGEEMMRVGMTSWGLFDVILTMALVEVIFIRKYYNKLPLKNYVYIGGALMFVAFMLTLTRRTLLDTFFLPLIILLLTAGITKTAIRIFRLVLPFIFAGILLAIIAPKYVEWIPRIYKDTSLLIFTGKDTRGEQEYRVSGTGAMMYVKENIREKPLLGTGFYWMLYEDKDKRVGEGDTFAAAWAAANEMPIYWVFFNQGLLGFILYIPIYFFILQAMLALFKLFKNRYREFLFQSPVLFLMGMTVLIVFIQKFTVKAYSLFADLSRPGYMVFVGLLFSIWFLYKNFPNESKTNPDSGASYR
jgi:hypothetical protein